MKKMLTMLLAVVMCLAGAAMVETVLQLGTTVNEQDSYQVAAEKFAELVAERTNGEYRIEIYPNGDLGGESDMLDSMSMGMLDMGIITSGHFGCMPANCIRSAVLAISQNKCIIRMLISIIILIVGVFMETSSAIILTPVFLPLVRALGVSTLYFGILFVVGIAIGHVGMKYSLVPHDLIADFTEAMTIAHQFDGQWWAPTVIKEFRDFWWRRRASMSLPSSFPAVPCWPDT